MPPDGVGCGLASIRSDHVVAIIVQGVPHPSEGASAVLFFHYAKAIADAGYRVMTIALVPEGTETARQLSQYEEAINSTSHMVHQVPALVPVVRPNRFGLMINEVAIAGVGRALAETRPDAVIAFDVGPARCVARGSGAKRIAWLGDLGFESNWYHYLYGFREDWKSLRRLPYALAQTAAWKRFYQAALSGFDRLIVASKSSERSLARLGLDARFAPYPWPEAKGRITAPRRGPEEKPRYLFYGHLSGLGSRSSLHFLFNRLYPELVAMWGENGFEIVIGGREAPPAFFAAKIDRLAEITYVGFIDDLGAMMATVHAVIAPLDVPVGNRSRLLTAMAKGALVIAHENAALGNPMLADGQTALLARDAAEFARQMRLAVESPDACTAIVDRAEKAYLDHYAPEAAARVLVRAVDEELEIAVAPDVQRQRQTKEKAK